MAHTLASLEKLGKSDLARLVIDYQNKFDTVLNNINSELLDLKNKFIKLVSNLEISRNVNNKLIDQVTRLERGCLENEQYSRRKCIETSGIPKSIKQIDLERTVFDKIDAPVDQQNIEACCRLKSNDNGRSNKVIVKFSKGKDMVRVTNKKKSLKNVNLDRTGLPPSTSLFLNPSLCSYYKYLWSKCKALWSSKLISSFWVSNGSLRMKLGDDTVKPVTHKDDLKVLFSGNPILMDKE